MKRRRPAPSEAPLPHAKPLRKARLSAEAAAREAAVLRRGELRHDLIVLSGGRCCACRRRFEAAGVGFEAHHMVYGSGRRKQHESLQTMAPTCVECHDKAHDADESTLLAVLRWAEQHGSPLAVQAVRRRLEKKREAGTSLRAFRKALRRIGGEAEQHRQRAIPAHGGER